MLTELEQKIKDKRQQVAVSVHQDLPQVNVDPKLVRHVYMNLLTNAIKYTPEQGEISILISKKDNDILSQISDNGKGIPQVEQKKVFSKFFRASNIVALETEGTGLGLYLVKAIVESSGGKIWFKSQVNQGTSFWFTLPIAGIKPKKGEVKLSEESVL